MNDISERKYLGQGQGFTTDESKLAGVIVDHFGCEAFKVTREARFVEDLGADSLDMVELVMAVEDEFSIEISNDEGDKIVTVQDAFAILKIAMDREGDAR